MTLSCFVNALIDNNINISDVPKEMDLILDGGAFNGIYMIGGLLYIKELERREKIIIKRISGCSIGSVIGMFYILDKLDIALGICKSSYKLLRTKRKLKHIINADILRDNISECDISNISNRFYITFFDPLKGKQIVKKTYKNREDLINTIMKTIHIPYLSDGSTTHKDGSIDGAFPYIFKKRYKDRKILFFNLQSFDKIKKMIFIKNEKNIFPRLFEGLIETHTFMETQKANSLCSYVDDWDIRDILLFRLREIIYTCIIYMIGFGLHIDYLFPDNWKQNYKVQRYVSIFKNAWTDILIYLTM